MKVCVTYVYPLNGQGHYLDLALRFITTYMECPAGIEHDLIVVCNGAPVTEETKFLFDMIPNVKFLEHDNSGYDCGAYQAAAKAHPCDLMVFFGASSYIRGAGWLLRMANSWEKRGPGLFGVMGNRGDDRFSVAAHIRTTGFWTSTELFNKYPHEIRKNDQRYSFEHGPECLTSWFYKQGLPVWVVSWSGEHTHSAWDSFPEGYHRGTQSNLIIGDRMTCPPFYPHS